MDEETPLLRDYDVQDRAAESIHHHFCMLTGIHPFDGKNQQKHKLAAGGPSTLYGRVLQKRKAQNRTYVFTSMLWNGLLLSQVILGAALTALGASESSHILITIFGAMNTFIAGLIAFIKSRGLPMRAKMFRDDLDRVIDEIENSEVMWLGISKGVHGYDEIDPSEVSVRSEVARLTRLLYDKAVRSNTNNDPDMYIGASVESGATALRARPAGQAALPAAAPVQTAAGAVPISAPAAPPADEQGPATAPPKPKEEKKDETPKANGKSEPKESGNGKVTETSQGKETDTKKENQTKDEKPPAKDSAQASPELDAVVDSEPLAQASGGADKQPADDDASPATRL
ncbi:hypothetical protein NA57DRAFT_32065 [Rhizodiscina lignyota]|uniref:SMODS and SLOG-associating 2TM effector domain-containing protein n=1 Tax=Rhizodiscina lignyota TaxID=1504668 RepID=A0A9P4IKG0_9PEZI|nr:hypothetical protein NA57DRAFT_32065 [Rhizodiscina lignyota]